MEVAKTAKTRRRSECAMHVMHIVHLWGQRRVWIYSESGPAELLVSVLFEDPYAVSVTTKVN